MMIGFLLAKFPMMQVISMMMTMMTVFYWQYFRHDEGNPRGADCEFGMHRDLHMYNQADKLPIMMMMVIFLLTVFPVTQMMMMMVIFLLMVFPVMQVIPAVETVSLAWTEEVETVSLAWTEETRVHTVKWIVIGSPTDQCYHPQVTGHTVRSTDQCYHPQVTGHTVPSTDQCYHRQVTGTVRSTAPLHRGASGVVVVVVGVMVDLKVMMVQGWARALTTTSIY